MPLGTFVKVGNITNLSDARYCAGMGVDMMGFCIDPGNKNYVNPGSFQEITKWVSLPHFVGEIMGSQLPVPDGYKFSFLQISDLSMLNSLSGGFHFILSINTDELDNQEIEEQLANSDQRVDYILFESSNREDINNTELNSIMQWAISYPILLGYGISPSNIDRIVNSDIKGISLYGSREAKTGSKDYNELAEILEALETD